MGIFLKGLILGFSIAAPVGPIGVLCIRRTLAKGRLSGFLSGMGAAVADAAYGAIAAFGLTAVANFLVGHQFKLQFFGGVFLLYIGLRIAFRKKSVTEKGDDIALLTEEFSKKRNLLKDFFSTVFLTLTNPTTIISFMAIFAGFGLISSAQNYASASVMVTGVFLGSLTWWLLLVGFMDSIKHKLNGHMLERINLCSGILITTCGVLSIAHMTYGVLTS
ncbi:MAG: LysE family translocator [Alphaproteobacteria bacterium]